MGSVGKQGLVESDKDLSSHLPVVSASACRFQPPNTAGLNAKLRPLHLTLKPISKNTFSLKYLQCGSYYSSIHQLSAHNNPPLGSKALLVPSPPIFSFSFTVVKEEAESKVSPKTHPWQNSFGTGALWVPLLGRVLSKRLTPSYSDLIRSQTRHTPGRLSPSQPALSGQLATTGHHW